MTTRRWVLGTFALFALMVFCGCGAADKMIKKDLGIEEMDKLRGTYKGKDAWTRAILVDIGTGNVIDRDTKVKIIDLDLHWNGAVTVEGPKRRRLRHSLEIERPLTLASVEEKLNRLFWFYDPEYRYRMNLRKYGKKTAKAIFDHQLFKGMKREAALESWGYPDEINSVEVGGSFQEQWIYRDVRQKTKKRYIYVVNALVDSWEE